MTKNKIVIFDLDNCISNDGWRIPLIKWKEQDLDARYRPYHRKCIFDEFSNRSVVREHQRLGHKIAVLTARPSEFSNLTYRWLIRNEIEWHQIHFREKGCHLHSKDLKEEQLNLLMQHCEENDYSIVSAYDDREDVVNMYKANGIDAKVLRIHDICAYTEPKGE